MNELHPDQVAHPPSKENPKSQSNEEHTSGVVGFSEILARNPVDKSITTTIAICHDIAKTKTWCDNHLCPSCWSSHQDKNICAGCGLKEPTLKDNEQIFHSPYGAIYLLTRAREALGEKMFSLDLSCLTREEVAYYDMLGGHHGGFLDREHDDTYGYPTVLERLSEMLKNPKTQEILKEIDTFIKSTKYRISPSHHLPFNHPDTSFDFFIKLKEYFSILCDSDSLDTERHSTPSRTAYRKPPVPDWQDMLNKLEAYISTLSIKKQNKIRRKERSLQKLRNDLRKYSDSIADSSSRGYFSMEFPTGLGKTLASFSFALKHAISIANKNETPMRRIIYVLPFLTITSQTTAILKKIFGGDDMLILEHHTGAEYALGSDESKSEFENIQHEEDKVKILATENWDYPIIVTTDVQFLESIMSAYRGPSRKIHNMADSIIILDEIQIVSNAIWKSTIEIFKSLGKVLNSSIVFTSATMPAFSWSNSKNDTLNIVSLVKDKDRLYEKTIRVRYHAINKLDPILMSTLVSKVFNSDKSTLLILNTRRTAYNAFVDLRAENRKNKKNRRWDRIIFLSTLMCANHRLDRVNEIKQILQDNKSGKKKVRLLVVSTQLVEAGIDLDFDVLYRKIAPLSSLVQSSGRCNREWNLRYGKVYFFDLNEPHPDPWAGNYIGQIKLTKEVLKRKNGLLKRWMPYDLNQLNKSNIYEEYHQKCFSIWSSDQKKILDSIRKMNYRTSSKKYEVIETITLGVVVPYNGLTDEEYEYYRNKPIITKSDLRKLQPFMVPLYEGDLEKHEGVSIIHTVGDLRMLDKNSMDRYDCDWGLSELLFS